MIDHYEQRAAAYAGRRDETQRLSTRISRLRLTTFLAGAASLAWAATRDASVLPLAIGIALLLVFAGLVVWHARVEDRAAWLDALHTVNRHALARIARAWDLLPAADPLARGLLGRRAADAPGAAAPGEEDHALDRHPYALDLDVIGRASLVQWLGPAATAAGTETLQSWVLRRAPPPVIAERQQAVRDLAGALDWREQLGAHGRLAAGVRAAELDRFLAWAEEPAPFSESRRRALQAAVVTLTIAIWSLAALQIAGVLSAGYWLIPVVAGLILSFATAMRVHGEFHRAGAGQQAFERYAALFSHAVRCPGDAHHLRVVRARLTAAGSTAPERMRQLARMLGFAKLASSAGIFHFVIQSLTLWDFFVFFALDRWRREAGPAVRDWMAALGELDALSAFARIKADNPDWCFPEVLAGQASFAATGIGHPLIPADRRVGNDVEVGPAGTLLLITGSNMSGKSTLLRAVGLNAVLAQAGSPVCASALRMPPIELETSIRIQDSLEHGLSYFMAALARLKRVVDRSRHPAPGSVVMYLLDEILQGTNTAERGLAVRGVARHLLAAGAIGVMTTHDLALAAEEPLDRAARLVHFTETVDEHGAMSFDYRLRPGVATSRNALRLMHLIGIEL